MKLIKWLAHLAIVTGLYGPVSSSTYINGKKHLSEQDSDVKTNFVSAVQIKEMENDSEENVMEHKLKMSVVDKTNPESAANNIIYLLKDKELKVFLRTLPIEMLRKLRTLASRDIESAQNFLIKLARERKRKAGLENPHRIGRLGSEAKPLISLKNFSRPFIFNNTLQKEDTLSKSRLGNSGFLADYKFQKDIANQENAKPNENEKQNSQSQWAPVIATPPAQHENTSTVTYIVHEVVYPKYSTETPTSSTTENYPSLQQPTQNPPPTLPALLKSPSSNYKPTVLHPTGKTLSRQKPELLDNYYGASRQGQGGNIQEQTGGGIDNFNGNPTLLLPHLGENGTPEYGWKIAPIKSPSVNSFNSPSNNFNANSGQFYYRKRKPENSEYGIPILNSNKNVNEAQDVFLHNNNVPIVHEHSFTVSHSNEPNYHSYPSPSNYYTMKPFVAYQNPEGEGYSTTTKVNQIHHYKDNGISSTQTNDLHDYGWNSGFSESDSNHKGLGLWSRTKSYFYKGDRTVAEKVFEISLGILAFLAFGGYILMLLYQVFAISAVAPLFPLVTQTIPVNPSLFGILFGRNSNSPIGSSLLDLYLNKMERNVKTAIQNFRNKLEERAGAQNLQNSTQLATF